MTEPRICVGVDDSKPSIAALRFAIDEAVRRGTAVLAVTSWAVEEYGNYGIGVTVEERDEYERRTRKRQVAAVELSFAEGDQRPRIIHRVVQSSTGPHPGDDLV